MTSRRAGALRCILAGGLAVLVVVIAGQCSAARELRRAKDAQQTQRRILRAWCATTYLEWSAAWQTRPGGDMSPEYLHLLVDEVSNTAAAVRLCASHRTDLLVDVGRILRQLVSIENPDALERLRQRANAASPRLEEGLSIRGSK